MSREFERSREKVCFAEWSPDNDGSVEVHGFSLEPQDFPRFIAWLQEGPPKKRYRITRTFEHQPLAISSYRYDATNRGSIPLPGEMMLTDADVEQVWE